MAKKDYETNTLIVSPVTDTQALESKELIATGVSFACGEPAESIGDEPQTPIKVQASIRYRQEPVPATLTLLANNQWLVALTILFALYLLANRLCFITEMKCWAVE